MERVTLALDKPFKWRVPWEVAAIVVLDTDADLSRVYARLRSEVRRWRLQDVKELQGPPSLDWWIDNFSEQPGKQLELALLKPNELNMLPILEIQGRKAHSLRTDVIEVGTEPVQGPDIQAAPDRAVVLTADGSNSGNVYIGYNADVSPTNGYPLNAGYSLSLNVDNISDVWFVADSAGQKVRYIVEVEV